ncbi:beta-N-acetylhexosaminidase [Paenibacillus sp. CN-4]|uniref:beta-N-acetylhexosaminidase n=1 Tax=Paenibacillus nanchangensis TaxID=3348343 RepID=UPI00397CC14C
MTKPVPTELSLEQKAARLCVTGLPGLVADPAFSNRFANTGFGGIGLFTHNISSEKQLRKLVQDVKENARRNGQREPYFMSIDEEGGSLSNLKAFYPQLPGNRAVGLTGEADCAYEHGLLLGSQLAALGIPMDWAPVLDVNTNIGNPVVGIRSFGEDPAVVADLGAAYIRGMHRAGTAVTAKHFPGHGQVDGDSHVELPYCGLTLEELKKGPLLPFAAAVQAGAEAIMVAHIVFPAISEAGGLPASLSPFFVTRLLREEMGYEGIICTDDVEMGAIRSTYEPEAIGEMAIQAGNDLVLMCHTPSFQDRVAAGIVEAVKAGRIAESRLDASLARLERLSAAMAELADRADPVPAGEWTRRTLELARRTVRVSADPKGLLPVTAGRRYALVLPRPERFTLADNSHTTDVPLHRLLEAKGLETNEFSCPLHPSDKDINRLMEELSSYDTVIMGTLNAHLHTGQLRLAEAVSAAKPLITVCLRDPYDKAYLPNAAACVLACSADPSTLEAVADLIVARSAVPEE